MVNFQLWNKNDVICNVILWCSKIFHCLYHFIILLLQTILQLTIFYSYVRMRNETGLSSITLRISNKHLKFIAFGNKSILSPSSNGLKSIPCVIIYKVIILRALDYFKLTNKWKTAKQSSRFIGFCFQRTYG